MILADSDSIAYRPAKPADAPGICSLYREAYTPREGGDPRHHYPFPQFLDVGWVKRAVCQGSIRWLVAEKSGETIGTVGALLNIGSKDDRVAECFGLVIRKSLQRGGIGINLFQSLCRSLESSVSFIIAETRTAEPGGWKIVHRSGFSPLGYEPFAHTMPTGSEPMLLTGWIAEGALRDRNSNFSIGSMAYPLAKQVLRTFDLPPLPTNKTTGRILCGHAQGEAGAQPRAVESFRNLSGKNSSLISEALRIVRDDIGGRELLEGLQMASPHSSGIVCLNRLEGEDLEGKRYDRRYWVGMSSANPHVCMRLVLDRLDRRLRILGLRTNRNGLQNWMLRESFEKIKSEAGSQPLTIVIDVCADNLGLQSTLETLGFFPTAYYPGLVATENGRVDAIQYTHLLNLDFEHSFKPSFDKNWPSAQKVISVVSERSMG